MVYELLEISAGIWDTLGNGLVLCLPSCLFHIFLCQSLNPADQQHFCNAAGQEFSLGICKLAEIQIESQAGTYGHRVPLGRCLAHLWLQGVSGNAVGLHGAAVSLWNKTQALSAVRSLSPSWLLR